MIQYSVYKCELSNILICTVYMMYMYNIAFFGFAKVGTGLILMWYQYTFFTHSMKCTGIIDTTSYNILNWHGLPYPWHLVRRTILTGSNDVNHSPADDEVEELTYQSSTDVYSILGAEDDNNTTTLGISNNPSCELDSSRG